MNTEVVDPMIDESIEDTIDERRKPSVEDEKQLSILFGTYADIMFILLPFFVVAIFKLWQSDIKSILTSYDLSMAAAILGGLALVKFVVGLLIDPKMLQYKERMVFLIAGTVFLVVVPGLLFAILVMLADPVPQFAMFVQPLLLVMGVVAYSGAVVSTNALLNKKE
ncbi:hypothetical protein [Alkalimarinus coralli]|uniref:hypothetical protein n=1 Tax=Alkalimarinus coralli TaxID=2935863 RepID=UPI00202B4FE3|nr:hypothetical protein [Alkalimarinus coralli]